MLVFLLALGALGKCASAQQATPPVAQAASLAGTVVGTVTDMTGQVVPNASVVMNSEDGREHHMLSADTRGFFSIPELHSGVPYGLTVTAQGFAPWTKSLTLTPGQYVEITGIQLSLAAVVTSVQATLDTTEVAVQQVHVQEEQKVFGFIPNFYTTYEKNPAPMTTKLKYQLALHSELNPITVLGAAFSAAIEQAADSPHYQQGWEGYGQRFGANYANGLTDIFFGGAVLPSILHQDPRYYYQGTGSVKSRLEHALSYPFICHGDDGTLQPNYSSLGGFLISGAVSEAYYPDRDRGVGLVGTTFGISLAGNMANAVIQEFILRKLTPSARRRQ